MDKGLFGICVDCAVNVVEQQVRDFNLNVFDARNIVQDKRVVCAGLQSQSATPEQAVDKVAVHCYVGNARDRQVVTLLVDDAVARDDALRGQREGRGEPADERHDEDRECRDDDDCPDDLVAVGRPLSR